MSSSDSIIAWVAFIAAFVCAVAFTFVTRKTRRVVPEAMQAIAGVSIRTGFSVKLKAFFDWCVVYFQKEPWRQTVFLVFGFWWLVPLTIVYIGSAFFADSTASVFTLAEATWNAAYLLVYVAAKFGGGLLALVALFLTFLVYGSLGLALAESVRWMMRGFKR